MVCRTYNAALAELLHFHDCALPASTTGPRARGTPAGADGRSRPLQAALLSLSQLHTEHGHVSAATTALLEAVDVDQGSGDAAALVMCLLQLCVIMRATPPFDHDRGAAKSPTAMMQVRCSCVRSSVCRRSRSRLRECGCSTSASFWIIGKRTPFARTGMSGMCPVL